jgi:hypothetical protein
MQPLWRKILLAVMATGFFVTVPFMLLRTAGYRWNPVKQSIERTGIIEVESVPSGAAVWLDGQLQTSATPASLRNLVPGDYDVRVYKAGYRDWSKRLTVESGRTVFTSKVTLLRDAAPSRIASGDLADGAWSPNRLRMAAVKRGSGWHEVIVWHRTTADYAVLSRQADSDDHAAHALAWSPDGHKILHLNHRAAGTVATVYAPDTVLDPEVVSSSLPADAYTGRWSSDNQHVILKGAHGVFLVSADGDEATPLDVGADVLDAVAREDSALLLRRDGADRVALERLALPSGRPERVAILPGGVTRFTEWRGAVAVAVDEDRGRTVTVDTLTGAMGDLGGTSYERQRDTDAVILWNEFEVYVGNLRTGESELITRLGEPLSSCVWHPRGTIIVCASASRVFAVELDDRGERNTWDLAAGERLEALSVDPVAGRLYFLGTQGGNRGIYELGY